MPENRWNVDRIMRLVLLAASLTLIILVLNYLSGVLAPFGAAFLVAYIFNPLVNFLQSKMRYRVLAVATVVSSAAILVALALFIFIPRITTEIRLLGSLITRLFHDTEWSEKVLRFVPKNVWSMAQDIVSWDKIAEMMQSLDFWNAVQSIAGKLISGSFGVLSGTWMVILWLSGLTMIIVYLIFMMLDMPRLSKSAYEFVPPKFRAGVLSVVKEMNRFLATYFRSQTIVASIVGVLFSTAFTVIGFPMGIIFGLFIGALNMVPYLQLASIPMALLLGIVYSLDKGIAFWQVALILASIYIVIQLLQDMILVPTIVGKSMNLPPVAILLSLSVWGKLLGFLGLIVAIPFTCLCLVYARKISKKGHELMTDEKSMKET